MANEKLTDEQLIVAIRTNIFPPGVTVADVCDELLRMRRASRQDSREAHQLRRLRWVVENQVMKTEALLDHVQKLGADRSEPPPPEEVEDADR